MSLGWHLSEALARVLVPTVLICLLEPGGIPEGGPCTRQVEADPVGTEEETVAEAPPVEEEGRGGAEGTGGAEEAARAQTPGWRLAVLGPESFVCGHYAGVLGLNF